MASIVKRGKSFALVYDYTDDQDVKRQKWETFPTKREAAARKAEVENQQNKGTFIPPANTTVQEFLVDFVEMYGSKRWGLSVYEANTGLIRNYINPILGKYNVQDISRRVVDRFILELQKTPPVITPFRKARAEFLPPCTIEKICKLLHCAFHQAVRWDMVPKNPFEDALLPKKEKKTRAIWTVEIIRKALDNCSDGKLHVVINLAFACSLRMGEITGLPWDCVRISDADIAQDNAHIVANKELARVSQKALKALGDDDVIFMFLRLVCGATSREPGTGRSAQSPFAHCVTPGLEPTSDDAKQQISKKPIFISKSTENRSNPTMQFHCAGPQMAQKNNCSNAEFEKEKTPQFIEITAFLAPRTGVEPAA